MKARSKTKGTIELQVSLPITAAARFAPAMLVVCLELMWRYEQLAYCSIFSSGNRWVLCFRFLAMLVLVAKFAAEPCLAAGSLLYLWQSSELVLESACGSLTGCVLR